MNKVVLNRTGNIEINGVEVEKLIALGVKSNGTESPTITVMFDADEFEIATGQDDFVQNITLPGELERSKS